jgi:hypothetical protein
MMKTMSQSEYNKQFEQDWNEWREMMKSLSPLTEMQVRAGASYSLSKDMAEMGCEGEGIGSSDINHSMFGIWKSCGKDKDMYVKECVDLYEERINA